MKNRFFAIIGIGLLVGAAGCKRYLDVNQTPNVAHDAPVSVVLPSTEIYLASAMGVEMQINGSIWAQYWTQSPVASQYKTLEQYQPSATSYDRVWELFYSSELADLKYIEKTATAQHLKQYVAISKLLQAYTFQVLTDAWGDVPYTQALKGAPEDGGITSPAYDQQQAIYTSLLGTVDSAIALIDPNDAAAPTSDDLIYGGDMNKWLLFANTLKLKMYLRFSEKNPAFAQAGIAALAASKAKFIDAGDDALINFSSTAGSQNPLYAEEVALGGIQNLVASKTVVDSMVANNDARVLQFFTGTTGIKQGNYNVQASASSPSSLVGALANDASSATAPVKFITSYESLLLQSEAVARGWLSGDAKDLFGQAIVANYVAYGLTDADAGSYIDSTYWGTYPTSGTVQQKVRHIITQKWFCMCGNQGFEAWTEWRRTGYPNFFTVSVTSLITPGKFPRRFFYPNDELTRNNKFPGQKAITDPVYWDVH
jgi:hypothetical protein